MRDYIHVMDLAEGHRKALEYLRREGEGFRVFNLGSGRGYSVLEMVNCLKAVSNVPIPYTVGPRREGDAAEVYADPGRAENGHLLERPNREGIWAFAARSPVRECRIIGRGHR